MLSRRFPSPDGPGRTTFTMSPRGKKDLIFVDDMLKLIAGEHRSCRAVVSLKGGKAVLSIAYATLSFVL